MAINPTQMPFWDHLKELRKRIFYSFLGVLAGFSVAYYFSNQIFDVLTIPYNNAYREVFHKEPVLIFTSIIESFMVYLKLGLVVGIFLACPFIFLQIWLFVEPALKPNEKKHAVPIILLASIFFIGGALFGYFGVFPLGFKYFLQIAPPDKIQPMLKMEEYFRFASWMMITFGFVFEAPLVVLYLTYLGIIPVSRLIKHWRGIVTGIAIASAVLTPADAASMILMMVPMLGLYVVTILVGLIVGRKRTQS